MFVNVSRTEESAPDLLIQVTVNHERQGLTPTNGWHKLSSSCCQFINLFLYFYERLVYFAHIQSHLQYGILLWGNSVNSQQNNKLTKIQASCLEYIDPNTGFKENKILRTDSLIELENSKFGYKLIYGLLPKKIESACMFDQNKSNLNKTHWYQTRHKKIPNVPVRMNKQYRASFLNKGSQSLLTIKSEIRDKPNLKLFSNALKEYLLSQY